MVLTRYGPIKMKVVSVVWQHQNSTYLDTNAQGDRGIQRTKISSTGAGSTCYPCSIQKWSAPVQKYTTQRLAGLSTGRCSIAQTNAVASPH